jgi:hypothetical protein
MGYRHWCRWVAIYSYQKLTEATPYCVPDCDETFPMLYLKLGQGFKNRLTLRDLDSHHLLWPVKRG